MEELVGWCIGGLGIADYGAALVVFGRNAQNSFRTLAGHQGKASIDGCTTTSWLARSNIATVGIRQGRIWLSSAGRDQSRTPEP